MAETMRRAEVGDLTDLERLVWEGQEAGPELNIIMNTWRFYPGTAQVEVKYHTEASYQGSAFITQGSAHYVMNLRLTHRGWRLNIGCPQEKNSLTSPLCEHPHFSESSQSKSL